jgi:hypothetical protein
MPPLTRSVASIAALWLFATLTAAASARADTIHVTSGALQFGSTFGQLSIAGDRGFTLQAGVDITGGIYSPWEACSVPACVPGAVIPLFAYWVGNDLPGVATLDGKTYPRLGSLIEIQSAIAQFNGQAVAPPLGAGSSAVVSAPFTFLGLFLQPTDGFEVLQHELVGSGTATLWLEKNFDGTSWRAVGSVYQFEPTATPEPATLALVGSGLALALAWRRFKGSPR